MSVLRQVAVRNFSLAAGLPQEMADEILGFCFYDTATAVHRAVHRANMAEVVQRFTGAWISRANTPEMNDSREQWAINLVSLDNLQYHQEVQFQATNCLVCGNYQETNTFLIQMPHEAIQLLNEEEYVRVRGEAIPLRLRCACH